MLATTCREYGEQHADSLTTMGNLAAILWQEGDRAEAYALQQQVVEMQRRLRGEDDPATRAGSGRAGDDGARSRFLERSSNCLLPETLSQPVAPFAEISEELPRIALRERRHHH